MILANHNMSKTIYLSDQDMEYGILYLNFWLFLINKRIIKNSSFIFI